MRPVSQVKDVLGRVRERAAALVAGDRRGLEEILHPRLCWITHLGAVLNREAYVRGNTEGDLRWLGQRLIDPEVIIEGGTAVVISVVEDVVSRAEATPETFWMRLSLVWVRERGTWVLLAGHAGPRVDAGP